MVWVALSGLSPHRKVSIPGGALTYQHRGCSWEKATSDQPLLIEAVNSSEVFLPQKHKAVGSGKVEKPTHQGYTQDYKAGQNSQGLLGSE